MLKRLVSVALAVVLMLGAAVAVLAQPTQAVEITQMHVSDKLVALIKDMEGFDAIPYWDYGQWTVGFGSRCPEEHRARYTAEGIPPEEAHELMMQQIECFEADVNSFMLRNEVQLSQQQFDAMVSFIYNVGSAVLYNKQSNVIKAILNGAEGNDFMYAIGQWCTAGGEFLLGLLRRRMVEAYMYLYGTYTESLPASFCYVIYDANGGKLESRVQGYDTNLTAVPLSVPTREGYTFTGWYTAATGGEKVLALDASTHGKILYAQWAAGAQNPDRPTDPESGITVSVIGNSVSIRQTAGSTGNVVSHAYRGEKITITGLASRNGILWGYFSKGWIDLEYTDYYEVTGTQRPDGTIPEQYVQVPIKATILSSSGVKVYSGPHATYIERGTLAQGTTIELVETMTFQAALWGRYEDGWILLNQRVLLHDENVLAHTFVTTITEDRLNVRNGPGTNYGVVMQAREGTVVEILSIVQVNGVTWGRFITGWICMDNYTNYDASKLPYYQNHTFGDWGVSAEATCAQFGQLRRNCIHCDHYEIQQTPKLNHTMGQWYVSETGDCVTAGQMSRNCANCNHVETMTTTLGDHVMGDWYVSVQPTCVSEGQERRDCTLCDHSETRVKGFGDHSFGEWTQTVAPGCETAGQEQRSCQNCTHAETREVAAIGHSYDQWYETVTPTATTEGEARRNCQRCDHFEVKVLPVNPHVYGDWFVHTAPTCTAPGEERRNCTHCDLYESRPIAATDHSYGDWFISAQATCVAPGQEKRECKNCDHFETKETALGSHSLGEWTQTTAPGCETVGQDQRKCQHCSYAETREVSAVGHALGEWYVSQAATCTAEGQEQRKCANCEHFETRSIEKVAHSLGEWFVSQTATCTAEGQEQRKCANCEHFEARSIEKVAHSLGEWFVSQAATCTAEGQERRKCANCEHFETRSLEKVAHSLGEWFVSQAATCTAEGQEQRKCANCDYMETHLTDKVAHSFGDWYILIHPTIDMEGQQCRNCENCDAVETETVPVLPSVEKVYATITVSTLNVRKEASAGAAAIGVLAKGAIVEILEQTTVNGSVWGRVEHGWICLSGNATVQSVREAVVTDDGDKLYATITCSSLYIRTQPKASANAVGGLYKGARLRVYETAVEGNATWGRTAIGWIMLTGNTSLETIPGVHLEHTYGDWYVVQAGNCVTAGQERRDCIHCEHYETREGQLGGHSFGEWFLSQAATCTAEGTEQRKCANCDHTESRSVAKVAHALGEWFVSQAATCTAEGTEQRKCANCDHTESRSVAKVAHAMGEWFVSQAATCTTEGTEQRKCANCEHVETRSVDKAEHSYGDWYILVAPTVDQEGQRCRKCVNCEAVQTETLPMLASIEKIYATITATSLNVRSDASTGAAQVGILTKGVTVEILEQKTVSGKLWGRIEYGWICLSGYTTLRTVRETATADNGDKTYATITVAVYIRTKADASASAIGALYKGVRLRIYETVMVGEVNWGRMAIGWIQLTGNTSLEVERGPHLEHTYGEWYIVQTGTCMTTAREQRNCTGCEHYETREGQLGDHSYGDWFVSAEATCVTPGQEKRVCQHCDHFETRETELGGHSLGQWYISVTPGCETPGQQRKDCAYCEYFESQEIASLGHSLGQWYISGAPDCVNPGSQCRDCENCEHTESQQISALGHSFGQWYVTKEASTTQVGQERRDCANCGHYETREVEKLPATNKVYGTYNGNGYMNIRAGAGTGYAIVGKLVTGQRVEILEQKDVNGVLWGRTEAGWVCITGYIKLEYVPQELITVTKLYATVTAATLSVYQSADAATANLSVLQQGAVVELLEIRTVNGKEWGHTADGWICLNNAATLATTEEEVVAGTSIRMYATVTCKALNMRQNADVTATIVGALQQGAVVEILEIKTVNGATWGRTAMGWICLGGNATLEATSDGGSAS